MHRSARRPSARSRTRSSPGTGAYRFAPRSLRRRTTKRTRRSSTPAMGSTRTPWPRTGTRSWPGARKRASTSTLRGETFGPSQSRWMGARCRPTCRWACAGGPSSTASLLSQRTLSERRPASPGSLGPGWMAGQPSTRWRFLLWTPTGPGLVGQFVWDTRAYLVSCLSHRGPWRHCCGAGQVGRWDQWYLCVDL